MRHAFDYEGAHARGCILMTNSHHASIAQLTRRSVTGAKPWPTNAFSDCVYTGRFPTQALAVRGTLLLSISEYCHAGHKASRVRRKIGYQKKGMRVPYIQKGLCKVVFNVFDGASYLGYRFTMQWMLIVTVWGAVSRLNVTRLPRQICRQRRADFTVRLRRLHLQSQGGHVTLPYIT